MQAFEERDTSVIVAASTECFSDLSLLEVYEKLTDLEYSAVEIAIHESGNQLKPSEVAADMEKAATLCRDTHRHDIVAYSVETLPGKEGLEHFTACCKLAKHTKVASIIVPSSPLGTPFNEEVERLRELVNIATYESARVSLRTEIDCLSEDPDTVTVFCNNVKGLGVSLDPSHYICGPHRGRNYDSLIENTHHVRLRDTSADKLQVRVGQGEVDYGKLVSQLRKFKYDRGLCVDIREIDDDTDHAGEMRKIRLLLESLI